jgi:DNA-binding NarL/FixJ family response regulator
LAKTRVLLADDHTLVRAGIRSLLEKMPAVEVVAEAGDGLTALELIRTHSPSLVLMDIAMSGLNGLQATERIAREFPAVRVIILSVHANEEYVLQALRSGAAGYLLKDAATVELELAITAVMRGETYLSPAISRSVIEQYLARFKAGQAPAENLTPRQREILQLIAEGRNTKEIAFALGLSGKTVETHRSLMMERLGIRDIPGLVRYAMRIGLVKGEQGIS